MASPEVPSQVTNKKYLRMPDVQVVVESDEEWGRCGQWSIFNLDADFLDRAWTALKPLLVDGPLIMVKASTARMKAVGSALICYTRPGKEEAKRAAVAIRRVVDFNELMHYKLNKLTDAGIARRHGHTGISTYMHTYLGRFYVRDLLDRWVLDSEENEYISSPISSSSHLDRGSCELPSESAVFQSIVGPNDNIGLTPHWYLTCSFASENDGLLPEADRVWVVANQLFVEGAFTTISWRKKTQSVEIHLYVSESSDVRPSLKHCDRIFSEACVKTLMYFTEGNIAKIYLDASGESAVYYTKKCRGREVYCCETKDEIVTCTKPKQTNELYRYKYTPEGELYEKLKFVLQREQ